MCFYQEAAALNGEGGGVVRQFSYKPLSKNTKTGPEYEQQTVSASDQEWIEKTRTIRTEPLTLEYIVLSYSPA